MELVDIPALKAEDRKIVRVRVPPPLYRIKNKGYNETPSILKETEMFKLYRASQEAQVLWIRNHPVQYVALNATLLAGFFGYMAYKDRKEKREIEKAIAAKNQA